MSKDIVKKSMYWKLNFSLHNVHRRPMVEVCLKKCLPPLKLKKNTTFNPTHNLKILLDYLPSNL